MRTVFRSTLLLSILFAYTLTSTPRNALAKEREASPEAAPIELEDSTRAKVAILGMFHFVSESNAFKQEFGKEAVQSQRRQREIEALVNRLADFQPTKIAVERPYYTSEELNQKYHAYLQGDYNLTAEETDQIAFRLGKKLGLDSLHLVKSGNEQFDMAPVQRYARQHSETHWLDSVRTSVKRLLTGLDSTLQSGTVTDGLRYFNSDEAVEQNYQVYKYLARIGERGERVGANLMASWQAQNLRIFANIRDVAQSGDRVLVIYGQAHKRELSRYLREASDLEYVDITEYL